MKFFVWGMIAVILLTGPTLAITFSEIHFNPAGTDKGQEFIEFKTNTMTNLTGYTIADRASNDILEAIRITNGSFIVIVEDSFNISIIPSNASIYSAGTRLGNGLGNTGDEIRLLSPNGSLITNATYDGSVGGDGISIILVDGDWQEGSFGGTPGWEAIPLFVNNTTNHTNATSNGTNETNEANEANETMGPNCETTFHIETSKSVFASGEKISFSFNFSKDVDDYSINYGIEDTFGDVRKAYRTTTNRATKSYTPRISTRVDALQLIARLEAPCLGAPIHSSVLLVVTNDDVQEDVKRSDQKSSSQEPKPREKRNLIMQLINASLIANQSEPFITTLSIYNDDDPHVFSVWSYAYRGSVSYSGDREQNKQVITMSAGEHRFITLKNDVKGPGGSAKFKVKIRRDNLKTPYEITKELLILPEEDEIDKQTKGEQDANITREVREDVLDLLLASNGESKTLSHTKTLLPAPAATSIFSSASSKAGGLAIPLFFVVLGLCVIVLVWIEPGSSKRNL